MTLHYDTIEGIGAKLRAGEFSSEVLTAGMLERIETHNDTLNAYITVTSDLALDQARRADEDLQNGLDRGPLHGIPVAVKDLFATKGIRTTGGSKLHENWIPGHDATTVAKLREAGAVLLGKTGLHELAYGTSSINPFFGAIRNPWDTNCDPGGSSGGSAVAVAAGLAFAALGTDTGCSVRQPAHCCGIVGHKPTFGLVSKAGVLPLTWTMDHVGPMTRNVRDAALVLNAIAGHDPTDPYSENIDVAGGFLPDAKDLAAIRFGLVRNFFFEGHQEVLNCVDEAIDKLRENGAEVVDMEMPDIDGAFAGSLVTFVEAYAIHEDDLEKRPDDYGADVREKLLFSRTRSVTDYAKAQNFRQKFTCNVEAMFDRCDVLIAPTSTIAAAPIDSRPADYRTLSFKNTGIFDYTGQPSISIPCGFVEKGLPVGLMLTGPRFGDKQVMQAAMAAEAVLEMHDRHPNV